MTDAIERLREENRADAARLEARTQLVGLMDRMMEGLEAAGFKPQLVLEDNGFLSMRVDPDVIRHGPALLPAPERAAPEAETDPTSVKPQADADAPAPAPQPDQETAAPPPAAPEKPKGAPPGPRKRVLKPRQLVTGPYSDEEIATTLEMIDNGKSNREIAQALNRDPRGVTVTVNRLKKERAVEQAQDSKPTPEPAPAPAPEPEPASAPAEPVTRAEPERPVEPQSPAEIAPAPAPAPAVPKAIPSGPAPKFDPSMSYAERECLLMLEAVGFPGRWTPSLTLTLVEALSRGDGLSNAAKACEVDKDVARMRWQNICPEPSWEAQQLLLKVLRGMVAKKVA